MFCTTLRRRPSYACVLPSLIATDGLKLRENRLDSHDLTVPISVPPQSNTGNIQPTRELRILLLAPSWTQKSRLTDTLDRIHHFASLTGGQDLAVIFLFNPPKTSSFVSVKGPTATTNEPEAGTNSVLAYAGLQASLLTRSDIPRIPILPLATVEDLPGLLKRYVSALSRKPQPAPTTTSRFGMLQLSTTEPPMDRQTAYFTTDCFASLRELAVACTEPVAEPSSSSPSSEFPGGVMSQSSSASLHGHSGIVSREHGGVNGLRQLRDLVGKQRYAELLDFWLDEWVVE